MMRKLVEPITVGSIVHLNYSMARIIPNKTKTTIKGIEVRLSPSAKSELIELFTEDLTVIRFLLEIAKAKRSLNLVFKLKHYRLKPSSISEMNYLFTNGNNFIFKVVATSSDKCLFEMLGIYFFIDKKHLINASYLRKSS